MSPRRPDDSRPPPRRTYQGRSSESLVRSEWLVTNRLGGFASCTVAGICTRRYHGWLIAAHPAPLGRVVLLTHLWEELLLPSGAVLRLG